MTESAETPPPRPSRPGPAPRSETSLRDVARLAGVSPSTASRVVSGSDHPVSAASRARVLEAAQHLRFQPNRLARALATARSQTIGVIVHDVGDPYFAQMIRGLEDVVGDHDHALFVASSDRDPATELAGIRAFLSHQVDAIVLAASGIDHAGHVAEVGDLLDQFVGRGGVVVSLSENPYPSPGVRIDNHGVSATATDHLVSLGHRRIAYLTGPSELYVNQVRLDGYRDTLRAAGIEFDPGLVFQGGFTLDGGRKAVSEIVAAGGVTGIVAATDMMAIGTLRGLADQDLRVPDDVSVVGIDDIIFTEYASVPLTSVHLPLTELGRRGGGLVMKLLTGGEPESGLIPHHLVTRGSTAPPKTGSAPIDGSKPPG